MNFSSKSGLIVQLFICQSNFNIIFLVCIQLSPVSITVLHSQDLNPFCEAVMLKLALGSREYGNHTDGLLLGSNYAADSPCVFCHLLTTAFKHPLHPSVACQPFPCFSLFFPLHLLNLTLYNLGSSPLLCFPPPSLPLSPRSLLWNPPTHRSEVQRVQKCAAGVESVFIRANETCLCTRIIIGGQSFERGRQTPQGIWTDLLSAPHCSAFSIR